MAVAGRWTARRLMVAEIVIVLALSLGRSAIYAIVDLVSTAAAGGPLRGHLAVLNPSLAPGRPWLDLTLQLLALLFGLAPVVLAIYLLAISGPELVGWPEGRRDAYRDAARGAAVAALIGSVGLGFYLVARSAGINLTVVAEDLPDAWWRLPVLVLSAVQNGLLEEVIMLGYLLPRLKQLGSSSSTAVVASALLRGGYHLYQGFGGFLGNVAMGLLFGWLFTRWRRVWPLVTAHALIDTGAFVGYALLDGHVGWLH